MSNTTKGLKRSWLQICAASLKVNDRAHLCLVKMAKHYVEHGDTSLICWAMDNAWSTGLKREAMIRWIAKYLKVKVTANVANKASAEVTNKNRDTIDMTVASGSPFYLDVEKKVSDEAAYDLDKTAKSFVTRAVKAEVSLTDMLEAIRKAHVAQVEKTAEIKVEGEFLEHKGLAAVG